MTGDDWAAVIAVAGSLAGWFGETGVASIRVDVRHQEGFVATDRGEIVGFLTIGACRDEDVDRATTGEIWGIYLAPSYWRKGIGRFLCGQAEKMLASRGFSVATLWVLEKNVQARRFYEAMGFAADGVTKEIDLGARLVAVRYSKRLHTEEG